MKLVYRGCWLAFYSACRRRLQGYCFHFPFTPGLGEVFDFCIIVCNTLHSSLYSSILDVVFEDRMTDVVFCPSWKWIQCGSEQACTNVVFQTNIARSALGSMIRDLIHFVERCVYPGGACLIACVSFSVSFKVGSST